MKNNFEAVLQFAKNKRFLSDHWRAALKQARDQADWMPAMVQVYEQWLTAGQPVETPLETAYQQVFGTPEGQRVLSDLESIANSTRVSADAPDVNCAIWKCAQLSLVQRIRNQIDIANEL